MRVAIALMVILSYPLQLDPSRRCLTSLIGSIQQKMDNKKKQAMSLLVQDDEMLQDLNDGFDHEEECCWSNDDTINTNVNEHKDSSTVVGQRQTAENNELLQQISAEFLFNGITCTFLVLSFAIALSVSDLGVILGVVGATGSTIVSYILPGAIYIKLHPEQSVLKMMAYVQLLLGILIVPTALYFVILKGAAA